MTLKYTNKQTNFEHIRSKSKVSFKKIVRAKSKQIAFENLIKIKGTHSIIVWNTMISVCRHTY